MLEEVINILLGHSFNEEILHLLANKIALHNEMYTALFVDNLKPKHHFLTHYPSVIRNSGPPIEYWCMRFESKHRELKFYTNATATRKNLPVSIGKKCLLKFAYKVLENVGFKEPLIINKVETNPQTVKTPYFASINHKFSFYSESCQYASSITFRNTLYKLNFYIFDKDRNKLMKINGIFIKNNVAYLITQCRLIETFDTHLGAFMVGNFVLEYDTIELGQTYLKPFLLYTLRDSKSYFKPTLI